MEIKNIEEDKFIKGLFRRKYVEAFWGLFGIGIALLGELANRLYFHKFIVQLKLVPLDARVELIKIPLIIIVGGFFIINALVALSLARIGIKTKKVEKFPYAGKLCLFDTRELVGEAAIKKGQQYLRAGIVYFLTTLVIIYSIKIVFQFDRVFGK
jgi:hypothetical protein